jgi:hypothetical protein
MGVVPDRPTEEPVVAQAPGVDRPTRDRETILAEAKARLLEKLPAPEPGWSAAEYAAIMDRFLEILQHLDA